jgi:hypothetical protein
MRSLAARAQALIAALRRSHATDPRLFRARAALGLLLFALVLWLIESPHPWNHGVGERLAERKPVRPTDWVTTWGWPTGAANALLLAGLILGARRWLGPADVPARPELAPPGRAPAWFALATAAAMATSAVLAWPRLGFSWAPDEESTVVRYVDGAYRRSEPGPVKFVPVPWERTFWDARTPNNHVPLSIASRLSLAAWRSAADPKLDFASERAVRLPAWLAGIASIAATAMFLRRLDLAAAGAVAAWTLALHPWHLRYASEARGYAFLLLLVPVTWTCLVAALHRGSWPRWLAYGLAQTLLLWSHAGVVWQLVATHAVAIAALWRAHRGTPALREQALRFAVVTALSAGVYAQLMLPNLVQIAAYLQEWQGDTRNFASKVLPNALAHLAAGVTWEVKRGEAYVELADTARAAPAAFRAAASLAVALLAAGALRLLLARGLRALLVPALLLPGPLCMAAAWLRHDRFYPFYLVFTLPALASLVSAGVTWPAAVARSPRLRPALAIAAASVWLVAFGWLGAASRTGLRAASLNPTRESVLATRPTLDPFARTNARVITVAVYRAAAYYDPLGHPVARVDLLQRLLDRADQRGVPLYVNEGRRGLAAKREPELAALVDRDDLFETVASFPGREPEDERIVRRYRGRRGARP